MPLQLSITDTTGVTYPNSFHIVTNVDTDGLSGTCNLKIKVWASQSDFATGKTPIYYNGWGQNYYVINCSQAEYAQMANDLVNEEDLGHPAKTVILKRVYEWLATLTASRTGYFDYTTATII